MNTSSEAAEQIIRISLEGFQVAAKITGSGAKDVAALLYAILNDKTKNAGKTKLSNMLKSGKELKVFSIKEENFKKFTQEAKRYGVLYCALIKKKDSTKDGIVDIMVKAEDAAKINRIVDRFKLSSFDEVSIRSDIEKSKKEKSSEIVNPHLAKTEKSPQSKPSLKMQKNSEQGTRLKVKESVKSKLESAKKEVKQRELSRIKSDLSRGKNSKEKTR